MHHRGIHGSHSKSKSPSVGLPPSSRHDVPSNSGKENDTWTLLHSNDESRKRHADENRTLEDDVEDESTSRGVPRPRVFNEGDGFNDSPDDGDTQKKSQILIVMGESKLNPLDLIREGGIYFEDPSNHISKCVSAFFDDNIAYHTVIEPCSNIETWKSIAGNENIKVTHVSNVPENIRDIGSKILSRR